MPEQRISQAPAFHPNLISPSLRSPKENPNPWHMASHCLQHEREEAALLAANNASSDDEEPGLLFHLFVMVFMLALAFPFGAFGNSLKRLFCTDPDAAPASTERPPTNFPPTSPTVTSSYR